MKKFLQKLLFLFLLFTITPFLCCADPVKIDSLLKLLETASQDTNKVKILTELSAEYNNIDPEQALKYGKLALSLAEILEYPIGISLALNQLGIVYRDQDKYENALEYYLRALKIREEMGDKKGIGGSLNNIGVIYYFQGNLDKTLEYFLSALELEREFGISEGLANSLNNVGVVCDNRKEYDKAIDYYKQSLEIRKELGDKQGMSDSYNNIGNVYAHKKEFNRTIEFFEKGLAIRIELDHKKGIAESMLNIGELYADRGNDEQAIDYLTLSIEVAKEIDAKSELKFAYQNLAGVYAKLKDFETAFGYYKLYSEIKDTLYTEEGANNMAEMQTKYETGKKEKENELLRKESELQDTQLNRQNIIIWSAGGGILLLGILAYLIFRGLQQKQKTNMQLERKNASILRQKEEIESVNLELEKLSIVARETDNYVIISDKEDNIEWVNEGFTRITGYKLKEVSGKKPAHILRGEGTAPEDSRRIDDAMKKKIPFTAEILNYTKKGEAIWLYSNTTPVLNNEGDVVRYITVGSDITARKDVEEKIKHQNIELEKLSIVASETDNAVFIMDAEGNLEWANHGFTKLFGYTLQEHIEANGKNLLEVSGNPQIKEVFKECKEKKKSVVYESINKSKDGREYWVQTTLTPIVGDNGSIKKLVAIDSDITIRKKAEEEITLKNREITDSIRYAQNIQQAMLPTDEMVKELLPNGFLLFKPKAIVSGDFYWMRCLSFPMGGSNAGDLALFAACDCTGHGVPGAFMSMICTSLLDEAVNEKGLSKPADIFSFVRERIISSLKQTSETQKDGMDAVLCAYDKKNNTIEYACANNPIYLIRGWELSETEKDRQAVGLETGELKPFKNHELKLQKNDTLYLCSDGYSDQFGGADDKRFMRKRFKELLLSIQPKSMEEQKEILNQTIEKWKGDREQTDDILIIGVRFA